MAHSTPTRRTLAALTATCTTAGLMLSACGTSSPEASTSDYKVGVLLQLSGAGSVYADSAQAGTKAALQDVNSSKKAGVRFTSVVADAGADAQSATTACSRLIQQDKVKALVVFVPGPQLLACNTLAKRQNIPILSLSSGAGNICATNLTGFGLVPNQQTLPVLDDLIAQGKKKWYFFGADYSTPKTTISIAKPYLASKGGTTVGESYEPMGTTDYSQDITKIVNAHPDVAFLNVIGNDDVALEKQWAADPRTKGITRVDILLGEGPAKALGSAASGIWSSNVYFSSIPGSDNDTFKSQIQAAGLKDSPDINTYVSYLQVEALASAVKSAGADGPKVISALGKTDITGPLGSQFQIRSGFSYQPVYLAQAQADGSFAIQKKSDPVDPKLACSSAS
ncbi:ABC transporter substrate-binding protein [Nocardioides sp. Iso805N]|uniref:ABC transporter substrate-binding protein n=1 Tax=Nocardioides sp. Iso805N TaxID=1283287 RepID=UPI000367C84E|nr:ABC transporter substrate-binding protein [Nocardioides sp. Iso805N]